MPAQPKEPVVRYFVGAFEHQLDKVNRIVIPAKWRTGKNEELVIIRRKDGSMAVFTQSEVMKILQKIENEPELTPLQKKSQKEMIFSDAEQVTCDTQGRITMNAKMLKHAGLKSAVTLVGIGERFDIWEPGAYEHRKSKDETPRSELHDKLGI